MKRFGWKNMMAVPKLQKITVNIGLGEASQNAKLLDTAAVELGQITGQKAGDHARPRSPSRISKFAKACPSAAR